MSDMRAIILVKKLTNYCDFVIKYFMSPQNIGENKVGVEMGFFIPSTVDSKIADAMNDSVKVLSFGLDRRDFRVIMMVGCMDFMSENSFSRCF